MSDDDKTAMIVPPPPADKPPEKPTVKIEAPPAWAVSMAENMQRGFATIRADVEVVANDVQVTKDRVSLIEKRTEALETRAAKNSDRAGQPSQVDLAHEAELAKEREAREQLAQKVDGLVSLNERQMDMLSDLAAGASKFLARPGVKYVGAMLWTALVAWLSSKGWVSR